LRAFRKNGYLLASPISTADQSEFLTNEYRKTRIKQYTHQLAGLIESEAGFEPRAAKVLLMWMFPILESDSNDESHLLIRTGQFDLNSDIRISDGDHFSIYFSTMVPSYLFSNSEFQLFLDEIRQSSEKSVVEVKRLFQEYFAKMPKDDPRRQDFLWKLQKNVAAIPRNL
jgi:hypothetical protein